jgi:hypothetical protein
LGRYSLKIGHRFEKSGAINPKREYEIKKPGNCTGQQDEDLKREMR